MNEVSSIANVWNLLGAVLVGMAWGAKTFFTSPRPDQGASDSSMREIARLQIVEHISNCPKGAAIEAQMHQDRAEVLAEIRGLRTDMQKELHKQGERMDAFLTAFGHARRN